MIVPARTGSKGLPGKNIRYFRGKPLLAHAIECAKETGLFDRILLSTDSDEYAEIGRSYGAEVPYLRPSELAGDSAGISSVLLDLLRFLQEDDELPEFISLLEPTCPLRTAKMVVDCAKKCVDDPSVNVALTISEVEKHFHPRKQFYCNSDRKLEFVVEDGDLVQNRQELHKTYVRNGACYTFRVDSFLASGRIVHGTFVGCEVTEELVNLDSTSDWEKLEVIDGRGHGSGNASNL